MNKIRWIFLLLFSQALYAGEYAGHAQAWFLDVSHKSFKWCVDGSTNERRSLVTQLTGGILVNWRVQIQRFDGTFDTKDTREPMIVSMSRVLSSCDGTEDLRIKIGTGEAPAKSLESFNNPLGLAQLESYDESQGWGHGFIWLADAPEMQDERILYAILFHEIGHVFGVDHISGTIMDAGLADHLEDILSPRRASNAIDINADLIENWKWGGVGESYDIVPGSEIAKAFEALVGENLDHAHAVSVDLGTKDECTGRGTEQFICHHSDELYFYPYVGEVGHFEGTISSVIRVVKGDAKIFRKRYLGREWGLPMMGTLLSGSLHWVSDDSWWMDWFHKPKEIDFVIEMGLNARAEGFVIDKGRRLQLFRFSEGHTLAGTYY